MKGAIVFALGAWIALASSAGRADPLAELERSQQALFDRIAPSVVYISRGDAFGSGFFVGEGQILTNAHVVGSRQTVQVVLNDGRSVEGTVIEKGKDDTDMALVEVPVRDIPPLTISGTGLRIGAWVAAVGHGMGGIWTFTTGMISNIYPIGGERPVFQTQIPLNPGASGGPVFDREGRVLGIVAAGIKEAQGINFAIRATVAFEALPHLRPGAADHLLVTAPEDAIILIDGRMVGKGPRLMAPLESGAHRVRMVVGGTMKERTVSWPETKSVAF